MNQRIIDLRIARKIYIFMEFIESRLKEISSMENIILKLIYLAQIKQEVNKFNLLEFGLCLIKPSIRRKKYKQNLKNQIRHKLSASIYDEFIKQNIGEP